MVVADCNSESDESLKLPLSEHVDALPIPECVACCCVFSFSLSCIGFFGFLLFIIIAQSLVVQDEVLYPNFRIADAKAVSVTVNHFNNSIDGVVNYFVSGRWNMTLILENPNPTLAINYTALHVRLWYKSRDHDMASTHLAPFIHQHMGETRVRLKFTADQQYVDDDVATDIIDDGLKFGVTLFLTYYIQKNNYFIWDEFVGTRHPVEDCYPLITVNSSNIPFSFNSTPTLCVPVLEDYNRCGDFYF